MKTRLAGSLSLSLLLFSSCSIFYTGFEEEQPLEEAVHRGRGPRYVAVLPFSNLTEEKGIEKLVRESFYGHFSIKPYRDIELDRVDEAVMALKEKSRKPLRQISPRLIGERLGADALIYGEVETFQRIYFALYSQLSISAHVKMIDAETGQLLWEDRQSARLHEGGIPFSPEGAALASLRSGMNLLPSQKVRLAEKLCRILASRMPSPRSSMEPQGPSGFEVQAGAFLDPEGANRLLMLIRSKGYPAWIRRSMEKETLWQKVIIGPYADQDEALRVADRMRDQFHIEPIVRRVK